MKSQNIHPKKSLMLLWSLLPFGRSKAERQQVPAPTNTENQFKLYTNYPNPFSTITIIYFALMYPSRVRIDIFDKAGKKIMTLANDQFAAGIQRVPLYKVNNDIILSSGDYTYQLTVANENGSFVQNKSLRLL